MADLGFCALDPSRVCWRGRPVPPYPPTNDGHAIASTSFVSDKCTVSRDWFLAAGVKSACCRRGSCLSTCETCTSPQSRTSLSAILPSSAVSHDRKRLHALSVQRRRAIHAAWDRLWHLWSRRGPQECRPRRTQHQTFPALLVGKRWARALNSMYL
ncbi:unnamed protein product [Ectocarpus sp. 4 AP-2014]